MIKSLSKGYGVLLALLIVSWGLRICLVLGGGQYFWADESRYNRAVKLVYYSVQGDLDTIMTDRWILSADHIGFTLVGSVPAALQSAAVLALGLPAEKASFTGTSWIPGLFFSLASVFNIGIIYALARRMGADRQEGLVAAFLMACSSSMFYWSRHLMPYDMAMALALSALWIGSKAQISTGRLFICGVIAGLAFLTYLGYWPTMLAVLSFSILREKMPVLNIVKRAIVTGLGFALPPAILTAVNLIFGRPFFLAALFEFSGTIGQGEYAEGWSLVWEYLWHTEHGLLFVWVTGVVVVIWHWAKYRGSVYKRGLVWVATAVGIYLILVLGSTGFNVFVIYGRLARQIVPFLCLATAFGVVHLGSGWLLRQMRWLLVVTVLLVQAGFNFARPLVQQFPDDVEAWAVATYGEVDRCSFSDDGVDRSESFRYALLVGGGQPPPPCPGKVIFRTEHPLQYYPYQYEGFPPERRREFRTTDISIRLVDRNQ